MYTHINMYTYMCICVYTWELYIYIKETGNIKEKEIEMEKCTWARSPPLLQFGPQQQPLSSPLPARAGPLLLPTRLGRRPVLGLPTQVQSTAQHRIRPRPASPSTSSSPSRRQLGPARRFLLHPHLFFPTTTRRGTIPLCPTPG
jgi:hypothetical protein